MPGSEVYVLLDRKQGLEGKNVKGKMTNISTSDKNIDAIHLLLLY